MDGHKGLWEGMDFLSLVRAKKKGKKIIPIFIQKLRARVIYECVLYSNKYGSSSL